MKKLNKKIIAFSIILSLCIFSLTASDASTAAFVDGCKSYSAGDWTSAIFSLKKAAAFDSTNNPDIYYMLMNAEIYAEDYANALDDCEWYLENFSNTLYDSNVMYLKGRCLFALGEYDKAVIVLSDFCHQNEKHDMYAAALFWIGECFYVCYQYDDAVALYQRVVSEFPADSKAPAAQYRIETINQRDREEKLLYLLKQTGEEYLFTKEEYEKQLKIYSPESTASQRQKLYDSQEQYRELAEKYAELEKELQSQNRNSAPAQTETASDTLLKDLKQKAAEARILFDYINDDKEQGGR